MAAFGSRTADQRTIAFTDRWMEYLQELLLEHKRRKRRTAGARCLHHGHNKNAKLFAWTKTKVHQRRVKGRRISDL